MRVGGRFKAKCTNIVTKKDVNCHGLLIYDTSGFVLSQLHPLNARLTLLNVLSVVHSSQFWGKLDEFNQSIYLSINHFHKVKRQ